MIKISVRLVRATQEGMVLAQRAVRTYTRYAYYSFRDRKGRQTDGSKTSPVDGPRHSLMYSQVEDFLLSQVRCFQDKLIYAERWSVAQWLEILT